MKHICKNISRIALAALMSLASASALAQYSTTKITEDYTWKQNDTYNNDQWGLPENATFSDGHFYHKGSSKGAQWDKQVKMSSTGDGLGTFNNIDQDLDAIKFTVGAGKGTISVYYKSSTEIEMSMSLAASNTNRELGSGMTCTETESDKYRVHYGSDWQDIMINIPNSIYKPIKLEVVVSNPSGVRVRGIVRYKEDSSGTDTQNTTVTTPASFDGTQTLTLTDFGSNSSKHVSQVAIGNHGSQGDITIESIKLTVTVDNPRADATLKTNESTFVQGGSIGTVDGIDSNNYFYTSVYTYNFNNSSDQDYYVVGGHVGAISVAFDDQDEVEATNFSSRFTSITSDFFWYYNGGGGFTSNGFQNGNTNYRYFRTKTGTWYVGASTEVVKVNNATLGNSAAGSSHSYDFTSNDAIGFKLDGSKTYLVRVFHNQSSGNVLYKGPNIKYNIEAVKGLVNDDWYVTKNHYNLGDGTYMTTYKLSGTSDVFWVRCADGMKLGGFDILVIPSNGNISDIATTPSGTYVLENSSYKTSVTDVFNNSIDVTKNPNTLGYLYLNGPTMPLNDNQVDGHKSVMINQNNAIGLKVTPGSVITVPYKTIEACGIRFIEGTTPTITSDPANYNDAYCSSVSGSTNTYTVPEGVEYIWITSADDKYLYISDITVTAPAPPAISDVATTLIDGDYQFVANSEVTLGEDALVGPARSGNQFLANNGIVKRPDVYSTVSVNGVHVPSYDYLDTENNFISFEVAANLESQIRVFYSDDIDRYMSRENLANVTYANGGGNAPTLTHEEGSTTFTFTGQENAIHYPALYWRFPASDEFSQIIITSSGQNCGWRAKAVVEDGGIWTDADCIQASDNSWSSEDRSRTINLDDRKVERVVIQFYSVESVGQEISFGIDAIKFVRPDGTSVTATPTLKQGNHNSDFNSATTVGTVASGNDSMWPNTNGYIIRSQEGGKVMVYNLAANGANRKFYVSDAKIASVEVLVQHKKGNNDADNETLAVNRLAITTTEVITGYFNNNFDFYPAQYCENTITGDGNEKAILNGNTYIKNGNENVQLIKGPDRALNETYINGRKSIIIDNRFKQAVKLQGGAKYEIKIRWDRVDPNRGTISIHLGTDNDPEEYETADGTWVRYYSSRPITPGFTLDLTDKPTSYTKTVWICNEDGDGAIVYYSGYTITTENERLELEYPVNSGLFVSSYNSLPLVYITDNGDSENFVVPNVIYVKDKNTRTDVTDYTAQFDEGGTKTVYPAFHMENQLANGPGTNNTAPSFVKDNDRDVWTVTGFEDTDNDKLYKVTFAYPSSSGSILKTEYYLWFANYLKVGWWVNRDAKLIVGSNDSATDQANIIIGDFYVSEGSTGNLYFDVINPEFGGSHKFTKAVWNYTNADGTTITSGEQAYNANKIENDGGGKPEAFSWTKMNDHKNHAGIELSAPTDMSVADPKREVELKIQRTGWPEWTAKLTFHYLKCPTVSSTISNNQATVSMASTNSSTVFYTTDGSFPTVNVTESNGTETFTPTNATYTYSSPITIKRGATYYAAQMVHTPKEFYITNPYTTHVESMTVLDMILSSSNKSNHFTALSKEHVVALNDPDVEYLDSNEDRTFIRVNASGTKTSSNFASVRAGGYMWSYPFQSSKTYDGLKVDATSTRTMAVLFGDKTKKVYRENMFKNVGINWKKDGNENHKEHLNCNNYWMMNVGDNYRDSDNHNNILKDGNTNPDYNDNSQFSAQNGNPQTECNGGIGGAGTEDGGMFLQPITGDFLRFEPEYDGIITVWMRTNGAGQSDERYGNITRRPVYVVDENGRVLKRSTIKPSAENYYAINGTYGEINSNKASVRHDLRTDWIAGLGVWKDNFKDGDRAPLPLRYKSTFRLYNYWYGFQLYQNFNRLKHTNSSISGIPEDFDYSMDVADSWVSRTAHVQSQICQFNSLLYRSDAVYAMEKNSLKYVDETGAERTITESEDFAKYGYELPSYNIVRYRFPVKAGKSYYIAGRGTKNGFVAQKFDAMPANYWSYGYATVDNRSIKESGTGWEVATALSDISRTTATNAGIGTSYNTTAVALNENSDNLTAINNITVSAPDNSRCGTTTNFTLTRTFTAGKWHPIVLPFSVSETRLRELFGDEVAVVYLDPYNNTLKDVNGGLGEKGAWASAVNPAITAGRLRFTHHKYDMLYANVPAFIRPTFEWTNYTSATTVTINDGMKQATQITFNRVTVDKSNLSDASTQTSIDGTYEKGIGYKIGEVNGWEYYVRGSYNKKAAGGGEMYFLDNNGSGSNWTAQVKYSSSGVALKAFRCWIEPKRISGSTQTPAPRLYEVGFNTFDEDFFEDGNYTDGIEDIIADDTTIDMYNDEGVYDMLGRKVAEGSTDGLPSGVYIFHGQKTYVR